MERGHLPMRRSKPRDLSPTKYMRHVCLFLGGIGLLFGYTPAYAHLIGGTHEVRHDGYFIDIGFQPEFPTTDAVTRFDFSVFDESDKNQSDVFTDVWVRIVHDDTDRTVFSGNLHNPDFGPTGFGMYLTDAGSYTVHARFQKNFRIVVATEFSITVVDRVPDVESADDTAQIGWLLGIAGGIALIGGLASILQYRKRVA